MCGDVEEKPATFPDAIVPGSQIDALWHEITRRNFGERFSMLGSGSLEEMREAQRILMQCRSEWEAETAALYAAVSDATIQSYVDRVIPELQFLANHANSLLETLPAAGSLDDARALTDLYNAWEPYRSLRDIYLCEMARVEDRFDAPSAPYVALSVDVIVRLTKWCEDRGMTFRV